VNNYITIRADATTDVNGLAKKLASVMQTGQRNGVRMPWN
jgi:hypothetical protein